MASVTEQLTDVYPISVTIGAGEQPTHTKLSGAFSQIEAGMDKLSKSIGDCWGEQYGTGASPKNRLAFHSQPASIVSLARLIGPAGVLNPLCQSLDTSTTPAYLTVTFNRNTIPTNVNEFSLVKDCGVYPPIEFADQLLSVTERTPTVHASIATALTAVDTAEGTSVFGTLKSSVAAVVAAGDYFVGTDGRVVTFTKTKTSYTSGTHTYYTKLFPDAYDGATYNVIPDFNESSALCSIGAYSTDHYPITLPSTSTMLSYLDATGNPLNPGDSMVPPTAHQLYLPRTLISANYMGLAVGDEVPEGFMYLWDDTTASFVSGITFKIHDEGAGVASLYIIDAYCDSGVLTQLSTNRYRLVTVGTTITESIAFLRRNFSLHDHSRIGYGLPIEHSNLLSAHVEPSEILSTWTGTTINSPISAVEGNDHPQYLMRYGWASGIDAGQYDNAMVGHLFMALDRADYTSLSYTGTGIDTQKIYFGDTSTYIHRDSSNNLFLHNSLSNINLHTNNIYIYDPSADHTNNHIRLQTNSTTNSTLYLVSQGTTAYLSRISTLLTLYSPDTLALTGVSGITLTGTITAGTLNAGAITGTSLSASGGAITGGSLNVGSGTVTCGAVVGSGAFSGTSLNVGTGSLTCGAISGVSGVFIDPSNGNTTIRINGSVVGMSLKHGYSGGRVDAKLWWIDYDNVPVGNLNIVPSGITSWKLQCTVINAAGVLTTTDVPGCDGETL